METPSKKRRVIALEKKKKIIEASKKDNSISKVGELFGFSRGTVQTILREKATTLSAIAEGGEAKRAHLKAAKHEDLEEAVLRWVNSVRSQKALTGPLIIEKALQLAVRLGIEGFRASEGWLSKFKHRHSIAFRSNQGQAGEIDMEELGNGQQEVLQAEISKFSPDNVFNADETGLIRWMMPWLKNDTRM